MPHHVNVKRTIWVWWSWYEPQISSIRDASPAAPKAISCCKKAQRKCLVQVNDTFGSKVDLLDKYHDELFIWCKKLMMLAPRKSPTVNDIKFWWTSSFTQWHADESQLVCWPKFVQVLLIKNIRSTYNKTLGWEPWSSGYGRRLIFQSQYRILDGHFFTFICCKVWNVCLKRRKKQKRGRGWHIYL